MATLSMTLKPRQSRALAIVLLVVAVALGLALLIAPWLVFHRHYDVAIDSMTDRLERYRRVAAQGPEYRKALDAVRAKDGRRFFLKNTAPNLAGAELQDMVKAAIENNAGRLTTISITAPQGRRALSRYRSQPATFCFYGEPAENPLHRRDSTALSGSGDHADLPAQCISWLQAGARQ